jgi:hypothetical protein
VLRVCIVTFTLFVFGCSSNVFRSTDKADPGEDAAVALENDNPSKAISILEAALKDDPDNYRYMSLLAAAKAQKFGVSVIQIALKMAETEEGEEGEEGEEEATEETDEESDSNTNDITNLFPVLPDPTDANIDGIKEAIDLLAAIPNDELHEGDIFLLSLLNTAVLALRTKTLDADGDGQLSPVELLDLNADTAIAILEDLASASAAFASGDAGSSSEAAQARLEAIQASIDAQEGETEEERLRNYFNSR